MKRENGYYWVQLKEEKSLTIMHWNGLFWKYNYPYQMDTIFESDVIEVGERIPSNEDLSNPRVKEALEYIETMYQRTIVRDRDDD